MKYYLLCALLVLAGCTGTTMENPTIIIETNKGTITAELFAQDAPVTTENFLRYVDEQFFDGTVFHRVIPDFMIQGGGFTPDGTQKDTHAPIRLETSPSLRNDRGTLAMARTNNPNSATAQFFINVVDNDFLNAGPGNDGYAVFGRVISGMDVVDEIVSVDSSSRGFHQDWPVEDVIITSITRS